MDSRRYRVIDFRCKSFYLDTIASSPVPAEFTTGRVIDKTIEWVKNHKRENYSILDFCSGQGIVGLSVFDVIGHVVDRMVYSDVNYFSLEALKKNIHELCQYTPEEENKHEIFLSDGLDCIPKENQFDLIISNPPHRDLNDGHPMTKDYSFKNLYLIDPNWDLHRKFYKSAHNLLKSEGEIWFIELAGSPRQLFEDFIKENPNLEYLGYEPLEKLGDEVPNYYWMGSRLKK